MNYKEVASKVGRSYETIRQWRRAITQISGYKFKRVHVRNGRGRKNRTTYYFSESDVERFMKLAYFLESGKNKIEAISEVFGNKEVEKTQKRESELETLKHSDISLLKKIIILSKQIDNVQSELNTQKEKISDLTKRVEALENKGFFKKFNR